MLSNRIRLPRFLWKVNIQGVKLNRIKRIIDEGNFKMIEC